MSENSPVYLTTPAPALLTTAQLATLADTLVGERQSCADEPATPLGFWPTAVAALLSHIEETNRELSAYQLLQAGHEMDCAALAKVGQWDRAEAASELEYTRQMGRETEKAMATLAGRVKELQAELAEQECAKLRVVQELKLAESTIERATKQLEGFDGVRSKLELLGCSHGGFPTVIDAQLHDLWKNTAPLCELETMQRGHEAYRAVVKQHLRQILALDGSRLDEVPMLILEAARQLSLTLR